jgi:hypothetical protein
MGLDWVTGFIEHLQLVITSLYGAIANSRILQFTIAHTESSLFAISSPVLTSAVGIRYQRTGKEKADRKDSVRAIVNWRMYELAIAAEAEVIGDSAIVTCNYDFLS